MEKAFISLLTAFIDDNGKKILEQPDRFKSLFLDYSQNEYRAEAQVFSQFLASKQAQEVKNAEDADIVFLRAVAERFHKACLIDKDICFSIVLLCAWFWKLIDQQFFEEGMSGATQRSVPVATVVKPEDAVSIPVSSMIRVEGGTFQMGSANGHDDEMPVHTVTVGSFYIGKYEVTQKEYEEVMGSNPSGFKGANRPVEQVRWYDAVEYCNKRSVKEGLIPCYRGSGDSITCNWNASGYRLPTEAEWEYAAKGGSGSPGNYTYSGSDSVDAVAWYDGNSGDRTHDVGTKAPNGLGIYDMSGNVWEWCWDRYGGYSRGAQTDPVGASSGSNRVERGGSWFNSAPVRPDYRDGNSPYYRSYSHGFRVLLP